MLTTERRSAFVIYLLLYTAAHFAQQAQTTPWQAGSALALAFSLRYGRGWLPLVAIPALLSSFLDGGLLTHPGERLVSILGESAAVVLTTLALFWKKAEPLDLLRRKGVLAFLTAVAVFSSLLTAYLALFGLCADTWQGIGSRFLSTFVTALYLAPLILMICRESHPCPWRLKAATAGEIVLQAAALILTVWEVFGRFLSAQVHFFYLLFLPFAWIASRFAQAGVALALAVAFLAPVIGDALYDYPDSLVIDLQIRYAVLAVTALIFGAIAAERRQAEQRMQERQAELAHFQRLSIGWEMASALAHELSQPLTAAMNLSQAALRLLKAPAPDLDRAKDVLGTCVDKIERASQIIHGLRDFMRKGELTLVPIDLRDTLDDALRLVGAEISAMGAVIETTGLQLPALVLADRTQLGQVLINLLRNAAQAMAQARTLHPKIGVFVQDRDGMIEVEIADNGPGIAPEIMERLFEPFVTTKSAGMGLGLSISKSILDAHNGVLKVKIGKDGGAIFQIAVPKADKES